jgi:four helix bundle protein
MEKIRDFTDLIAWQKAHELVLKIYKITLDFPKTEIYGLTSQIRRAVVSITANIAEGFSRWHYGDRVNFYYNARGSLSEVLNFIITAKDLHFIQTQAYEEIIVMIKEIEQILNGLIRSTKIRKIS